MTELSPAAALAMRIAAHEARTAGAEFVDTEHLLIGILSLDKARKKEQERKTATPGLAKEHDAVFCLLAITGLDATVLRRLLRKAAGRGSREPGDPILHRSPGCKKIFARAAVLAEAKPAGCIHLFSAIMENPGTVIAGVLAESRSCRAANRVTDLFLPSGAAVPLASRIRSGPFDLGTELENSIAETRELLGLLPVSSREYPLVRDALIRQQVSLALLCLDTGDRAGLVSALQGLSGDTGDPGGRLAAASRDAGTPEIGHSGIPEAVRGRIRSLLHGVGNAAGE